MRSFSKRDLRSALAAVIAVLVGSTDTASAQYYYPYGGRYYGYDRRDDYDYIRRAPLRRDMDSYLRDRRPVIRDNDDDVQSRKRRREIKNKADAKNVADAPTRGPYHIFISIKHQRLALYGADGLIRTAPVSTGMQGHPTPAGVFTVIGKEIFHRSNIYSNAPMPLMQRITWSGVAIHQGVLPGYPASHGCIRMNGEFAQFLWKTTKIGARVIIAYDDPAAPVQISSPKLFTPVKNFAEHLTPSTAFAKPDISEAKRLVRTAERVELEANTISNDAQSKTVYFKPPLMVPRHGPVSVFISRKTGKVHVRYAYTPLFEMPVKIERPEQLIGTHIFTAMEVANDGKEIRWVVTSLATSSAIDPAAPKKNSRDRVVADLSNTPILNSEPQTAANALNRIELPKEVVERVSEILTPGSTLIISDYGISDETGQETDFIILTR